MRQSRFFVTLQIYKLIIVICLSSPLPSRPLERKKRGRRGCLLSTYYQPLAIGPKSTLFALFEQKKHPSAGRFCTFFAPATQ